VLSSSITIAVAMSYAASPQHPYQYGKS
jgi:hypothetical protein